MFEHRKSAAVLVGAALVIALAGCAGAAESASGEVDLHQERYRPSGTQAVQMQGTRLAEYVEALAAASSSAAEEQGQRLTAHAAALAAGSAAEAQGMRLTAHAAALASAGTGD
jgi:hypothetical protein